MWRYFKKKKNVRLGRFLLRPGTSEPASPPPPLAATDQLKLSSNTQTKEWKKTLSWPPLPPAVLTCHGQSEEMNVAHVLKGQLRSAKVKTVHRGGGIHMGHTL